MKKKFYSPEMSVISVSASDIICTSGFGNKPNGGTPNPQVTPTPGSQNPWSGGLN